MTDMNHMKFLVEIAQSDVRHLEEKEKTYQGSWKKRGGVGAAMMVLRKVDRLENFLRAVNYDIFEACHDMLGADGTPLAEIRDLRRYLLLVEAELQARSFKTPAMAALGSDPGTPEDGGHHARYSEER